MDIAVDDGDRYPQVLAREEELLGQISAGIGRHQDHPELGAQSSRVLIPVEIWLSWMRFGKLLHQPEGSLVEHQREPESLRDRAVCDVVVSEMLSAMPRDDWSRIFNLRRAYPTTANQAVNFDAARSLRLRDLPRNDKIISLAHPAYCLDDFGLIIFNDLDPFKILPPIPSK